MIPSVKWWATRCLTTLTVDRREKSLSRVRLFASPWTVAHQAPLSMGFSRQEYWSGLPFTSPGDLPNTGIEPRSPALQADTLTSVPPGKPYLTQMENIYVDRLLPILVFRDPKGIMSKRRHLSIHKVHKAVKLISHI